MREKPAFCTPFAEEIFPLTIRGQKRVLLPPFSEVFTESSQKDMPFYNLSVLLNNCFDTKQTQLYAILSVYNYSIS